MYERWPFKFNENSLVVSSKATRISAMIQSLFQRADRGVITTIGPRYFQACYDTLQKMSKRDLDERSFISLYIFTTTITTFRPWDVAEILPCFKALRSLLDVLQQSLTPSRTEQLFRAWEIALSQFLIYVVWRILPKGMMDAETFAVADWLASLVMGGKVGLMNDAEDYGNQVILLLFWCCRRIENVSYTPPQISTCLQVMSAEVKNHVAKITLSDAEKNDLNHCGYAANLIIRFISVTIEETQKGQESYSIAGEMWALSDALATWDPHNNFEGDRDRLSESKSSDDNGVSSDGKEHSNPPGFRVSRSATMPISVQSNKTISTFRIAGLFMAGLIFSPATNPVGISSASLHSLSHRIFDNRYQDRLAYWTIAAEFASHEGHAGVLETS